MHSNLSLGSPGIKDVTSFKSNSEFALNIEKQAFFHEGKNCLPRLYCILSGLYVFFQLPSLFPQNHI